MTLSFLGFAMSMFFVYDGFVLVPELLITLMDKKTDEEIREWENALWLRLVKAFVWHPGYFFFNMAFVINILRWDKLLKEQHYLRRGWREESLEVAISSRRRLYIIAGALGVCSLTFMSLHAAG